jgi:hypothetical protein
MKTKTANSLSAAALGISLVTGVSAYTATYHSATDYRATRADVLAAANQKRDSKIATFTGTIAKQGDQFVLTDDSSKSSYSLDDQQTAEKFVGKKVRVKGILDAVNNTIRIQAIEIAAA